MEVARAVNEQVLNEAIEQLGNLAGPSSESDLEESESVQEDAEEVATD